MPGLGVRDVEVSADGTRVVHAVTADETAAACPSCGVVSTSVKQNRTTRPRDLPYGEAPLRVRWHKRRLRCREPACARKTFTETIAELPHGARLSGRLRRAMAEGVGDANRAVSEVAQAHGVSWPTAHRAFVQAADAVLGEPEPTPVLGIDETRRGKARWVYDDELRRWRRVDRWHTGFVDLHGAGGLLGQVEGRRSADVTAWFDARSQRWRHSVRFVAIDPSAAYAAAVRSALPHVQLVVDHFHLVQLANDTVTKVRRRVTWENRGRRGRKVDPEWANRRRLLTARERLREASFARMWNDALDGDPSSQVLKAWIAKEELRALLATACAGGAGMRREDLSHRKYRFLAWCADADVPEVTTLAETVDRWWPEIEAFCRTGITNAGTEGVNRVIKDVSRRACGFRNPDNHRRRVRFHCTRRSRRNPALEGQLPPQS